MANGDAPNCYFHDRHDHGINDNGPVEKSAGPSLFDFHHRALNDL